MQFSRTHVLLVAVSIAAACSNANSLSPADDLNVLDTATIYAIEGTPITSPSGFSVAERRAIRTDSTTAFDFAYNLDEAGQSVFLPLALLGLGANTANPGLKSTTTAFSDILTADRDDYVTEDTVSVVVGSTFLARSRVVCTNLGVPLYGKIEVIAIDPVARSITFQFLSDINCGYLGLEPGLPEE